MIRYCRPAILNAWTRPSHCTIVSLPRLPALPAAAPVFAQFVQRGPLLHHVPPQVAAAPTCLYPYIP